jgi:hypothetical protein
MVDESWPIIGQALRWGKSHFYWSASAKPIGTKNNESKLPMSTMAATLAGSWSYASANMYENTPGGKLANNNTAPIWLALSGMKR